MTPGELVDILTEEDRLDGLEGVQTADIRIVQNAIVRALPQGELKNLLEEIEADEFLADRLGVGRLYKLHWMIDNPSGSRRDEIHRNEPLSALLRMFTDKKSGHVGYSRREIRRRYPYQSYRDQLRILKQMFEGNKDDRMWACRRLSRDRIPGFENELRREWESRHELPIAYVALRHLPGEYMLTQIDGLRKAGVEMWEICSRLGNLPGFPYEIAPEFVSPRHYIQTMVRLGRSVPEDDCRQMIRQVLVSQCDSILRMSQDYGIVPFGSGLVNFSYFPDLVWALGKLGYVHLLRQLLALSVDVASHAPDDIQDVCRTVLRNLEGEDALTEYTGVRSLDNDEFMSADDIPDSVKDFMLEMSADGVRILSKDYKDSIC